MNLLNEYPDVGPYPEEVRSDSASLLRKKYLLARGDLMETEFEFSLPRGFVDFDGNIHREGRMRLATALDEIES